MVVEFKLLDVRMPPSSWRPAIFLVVLHTPSRRRCPEPVEGFLRANPLCRISLRDVWQIDADDSSNPR